MIRVAHSIAYQTELDVDWDDQRLFWDDYSIMDAASWRAQAFREDRDAVLVAGTNPERQKVNNAVRRLLGHGDALEPGEVLCCFKNDHQRGIMNGETFNIDKVTETKTDFGWVNIVTRQGDPRPILVQPATVGVDKGAWPRFNDELWETFKYGDDGLRNMEQIREHLLKVGWATWPHIPATSHRRRRQVDADAFLYVDHGYCLTIHKSQGSEWDEVGCLLGSWILNNKDQKFSRQAQYTAVTRTRNKLLVWA